ncbi:uncharacterized protein LOC117648629 [Thrips palmi]|uniref:Uncharacterized protein LOC117648629 n=1 Tax=Thrips palmi TaxID=161013 RepID=A0A6P8Z9I7_THRPL|nr:uncharacterized protein LOC117648629 [Thrips palmi]
MYSVGDVVVALWPSVVGGKRYPAVIQSFSAGKYTLQWLGQKNEVNIVVPARIIGRATPALIDAMHEEDYLPKYRQELVAGKAEARRLIAAVVPQPARQQQDIQRAVERAQQECQQQFQQQLQIERDNFQQQLQLERDNFQQQLQLERRSFQEQLEEARLLSEQKYRDMEQTHGTLQKKCIDLEAVVQLHNQQQQQQKDQAAQQLEQARLDFQKQYTEAERAHEVDLRQVAQRSWEEVTQQCEQKIEQERQNFERQQERARLLAEERAQGIEQAHHQALEQVEALQKKCSDLEALVDLLNQQQQHHQEEQVPHPDPQDDGNDGNLDEPQGEDQGEQLPDEMDHDDDEPRVWYRGPVTAKLRSIQWIYRCPQADHMGQVHGDPNRLRSIATRSGILLKAITAGLVPVPREVLLAMPAPVVALLLLAGAWTGCVAQAPVVQFGEMEHTAYSPQRLAVLNLKSSDKNAQAKKRVATCPLCPLPGWEERQFPAHFHHVHNHGVSEENARVRTHRLHLVYLARSRGHLVLSWRNARAMVVQHPTVFEELAASRVSVRVVTEEGQMQEPNVAGLLMSQVPVPPSLPTTILDRLPPTQCICEGYLAGEFRVINDVGPELDDDEF